MVQVFSKLGTGDRAARLLADEFHAYLSNVTVDSVVFRTPGLRAVGQRDGWWQLNIVVPFFYNFITA
jgi:hypothetical protein